MSFQEPVDWVGLSHAKARSLCGFEDDDEGEDDEEDDGKTTEL